MDKRHFIATLLLMWAVLPSSTVRAESNLQLSYPSFFGEIPATTYDASGHAIGQSAMSLSRTQDGKLQIRIDTGADSGARTRAKALLELDDEGRTVRLLREESQSRDAQGVPLGRLEIDHVRGEATCTPPDGGAVSHLRLPEDDQVANVPLDLLFLPLARGDVDELVFQLFICRGGARFMEFRAWRADTDPDNGLVEVRMAPSFSPLMAWLTRPLVPKLSFWYQVESVVRYVAHRMPLFAKGPEVLVVRKAIVPLLPSAFR